MDTTALLQYEEPALMHLGNFSPSLSKKEVYSLRNQLKIRNSLLTWGKEISMGKYHFILDWYNPTIINPQIKLGQLLSGWFDELGFLQDEDILKFLSSTL